MVGAGKSSSFLVDYLLQNAFKNDWKITIGDISIDAIEETIQGSSHVNAIRFDVFNEEERIRAVQDADLVISMLPARLHQFLAVDCVRYGVDFISASYVSPEMQQLDQDAKAAGITMLNEMGLDPGIDHMSAMKKLDEIKNDGYKITAFETFTGGLVAPEYDNNPWNYKFTWNPRNVVLAGQGIVKFKHNGRYKYIPYHQLFSRYEILSIPGFGEFEGYPNRDSLKYREQYGLEEVDTIYRGTLRRVGFCDAWNVFVRLGMTDDSYYLEDVSSMTWRQFINSYMRFHNTKLVEEKLCEYLGVDRNSELMKKLQWLGIFELKPIGLEKATPAQALQHLLEQKWSLDEDDKDMIAMIHKYEYQDENLRYLTQSYMVTIGEDRVKTAMARTVGYPVGIGARLLLEGKINTKGVTIPTIKEVYEPTLKELEDFGIVFKEKVIETVPIS